MAAVFTLDTLLDSGGEADIYRVMGHPKLLLKIFREEPSAENRTRIDRVISRRNRTLDTVAAWPHGWTQMGGRSALVLPFVTGTQPIHTLFDRMTWAGPFPDATWAFMVKVARGAAIAVAAIHAMGLAVVDISEKNMLVGQDGKVTVIDCDSFVFLGEGASSISACYSAGWPPPELAPRLTREPRTANHDNFSLARLIFQLLFAGRAPLEPPLGSSPEDPRRVFGYSQIHRTRPPSPGDVALSDLPPRLAGYFERAFHEPKTHAELRPTAQEWADTLTEMLSVLQPCGRAPQHSYVPGGGRTCPWCRIAAAPRGTDPFRSAAQPAAPAPAVTAPPFPPRPQPSPPPGGQKPVPPPQVAPASLAASRPRSGSSFGWLWTLVGLLMGVVRFVFGWAVLIGIGFFIIQHSSSLLHFAEQAKRSVAAALQGAPAQPNGSVAQRAANYSIRLSADFGHADASQILDQAYAGKVLYFRETRSHAYVMQQKNAIIAKWTRRNYVPRPHSVVVSCNQAGTYCTTTLVTDFQVSNNTDSNSGTWSSTVGLDMMRDPPVVILEDGHAAQ